ncbi:hypothetical protein CHCC20375_0714 [Bacillus licheniformis]|nr:hypothetical protein CHCC20375_0714 [Bacillus licheniformis]
MLGTVSWLISGQKQVKRQTTTADAEHYSPENTLPQKQIKQDT